MLSIGGVIVPVLGWVVGVVLLWGSDLWSRREKLLGTLVVPSGLLLPIFAAQRAIYGRTRRPRESPRTTCKQPRFGEAAFAWFLRRSR
jgi:hypothetical protein